MKKLVDNLKKVLPFTNKNCHLLNGQQLEAREKELKRQRLLEVEDIPNREALLAELEREFDHESFGLYRKENPKLGQISFMLMILDDIFKVKLNRCVEFVDQINLEITRIFEVLNI